MEANTAPCLATGPRNGFRFINWARSQGLKAPRQPVLLVIASHADGDGRAWPTIPTLARESGFRPTAVRNALRSLARDGYLRIEASSGHRANVYVLSGAIQPALALDQPSATRRVEGHLPSVSRRVNPPSGDTLPSVSRQGNYQGTAIRTSSPNGDAPQAFPELVDRFLGADGKQGQVAALLDLAAALGVRLEGGRAAGLVGRHGHGRAVVDAVMQAASHGAKGPADYIEGVLRNGRLPKRGGRVGGNGASPGEAAAAFAAEYDKRHG